MPIEIVSLFKQRSKYLKALEYEYLKRFSKQFNLTITEIDPKVSASLSLSQKRKCYTDALLKRIKPGSLLILLDENGSNFTSAKLATYIQNKLNHNSKRLYLAIGGSYGWDDEIKENNQLISLSSLTLPATLARLVLIEQLYRVYTLIEGVPYHK